MRLALAAAALLALAIPAAAQDAPEPPTPASVIAAAPASDWKPIDPADLLVMDLAPDAAGKPRRAIVQLMPPPFSQGWIKNIRTLAKAHWWDGTSVYRVVDNWVAQWGDVDETRPLPEGVSERPESEYAIDVPSNLMAHIRKLGNEFGPPSGEADLDSLPNAFFQLRSDSYAGLALHHRGWPVALGGRDNKAWPTHCYGTVGVARSVGSGGTGSELYAVIGHAPRQLDRNIGVIGRVIEGIEHLSVLPRGTGEAGVYQTSVERTTIVSVRLGSELPDPPRFQYLDTESDSFSDYVRIRANRHDSFYLHPAGGVDVCNVQVPIRRVPGK